MKSVVKTGILTILVVLMFVAMSGIITYNASADMYDWHDDPRVYSEYDESGFGFYGIDEFVHIGNSFMIFIHYEPDYSGGWCKWCEYDAEGNEWMRERTGRISIADLSRTVDAWGTFLVTEIELRNEKV